LDGGNVSKDSDDTPTRVSAARERSHAAHERAEATHRRAAELHERAAAFQQQHAIAERKLGNVEKARRMEALSHREYEKARDERWRAQRAQWAWAARPELPK
jgi:predicted  nucleic acid-binding Zn-ribbon protein